jgi:hypothetical protein
MHKESTPCQLKIGKQSVLLSKMLNAEVDSASTVVNNKISRFLNILADDILCMRDDQLTTINIFLNETTFYIRIKHSYPFFSFLNDIYHHNRTDEQHPAIFLLDLNTPLEMITSNLIAQILKTLQANDIYKFNQDDYENSFEPFIDIDALDVFYAFDVIDKAFEQDGKLSSFVKNKVYHVNAYVTEDYYSIFDLRDFNSNNIDLTLCNNEFYIKVNKNTVRFEYFEDSMDFTLYKNTPLDISVKKFTTLFLGFYNAQLNTDHTDLARWFILKEMIEI